jgi:hypothetical protein
MRGLLFSISFFFLSLSGCLDPVAVTTPRFETGFYDATGFNKTWHVEMTMEVRGQDSALLSIDLLDGPSPVATFPPTRQTAEVIFDPSAGIVESVVSDDVVIEPTGNWQFGPQFAGMFIERSIDPTSLWPPVTWWRLEAGPGDSTDDGNGTSLVWTSDGPRKTAEWTTPCSWDCLGQEFVDSQRVVWPIKQLHIRLEGMQDEWLPNHIEFSIDGMEKFVMVRQAHDHSGRASRTNPAFSASMTVEPTGEYCGFAPCEPAGWPLNRSLQKGLELLEQSAEWEAWRSDGKEVIPYRLDVFEGHRSLSAVGQPVVEYDFLNWGLYFQKEDETTISRFSLEAMILPTGELAQPIVTHTAALFDQYVDFAVNREWQAAIYALGTAFETLVLDGAVKAPTSLAIRYDSPYRHPAAWARPLLVLADADCNVSVASMTYGSHLFSWRSEFCERDGSPPEGFQLGDRLPFVSYDVTLPS